MNGLGPLGILAAQLVSLLVPVLLLELGIVWAVRAMSETTD